MVSTPGGRPDNINGKESEREDQRQRDAQDHSTASTQTETAEQALARVKAAQEQENFPDYGEDRPGSSALGTYVSGVAKTMYNIGVSAKSIGCWCDQSANYARPSSNAEAAGMDVGATALTAAAAGVFGRSVSGIAKNEVGGTPARISEGQLANIGRFEKKIPANAKDTVSISRLPNGSISVKATSAGRVPGSSAVYEKRIDAAGNTTSYTKTTYDPGGNVVSIKDKFYDGR